MGKRIEGARTVLLTAGAGWRFLFSMPLAAVAGAFLISSPTILNKVALSKRVWSGFSFEAYRVERQLSIIKADVTELLRKIKILRNTKLRADSCGWRENYPALEALKSLFSIDWMIHQKRSQSPLLSTINLRGQLPAFNAYYLWPFSHHQGWNETDQNWEIWIREAVHLKRKFCGSRPRSRFRNGLSGHTPQLLSFQGCPVNRSKTTILLFV